MPIKLTLINNAITINITLFFFKENHEFKYFKILKLLVTFSDKKKLWTKSYKRVIISCKTNTMWICS